MPHPRIRWAIRALLVLAVGVPVLLSSAAAEEKETPRVRLAVLVIFDQMRGDYLKRWDALYGDGGFHRLEREGVWFQNCHYPYAGTVTGAGHASHATGTSAYKHGIIYNEWYDRKQGEAVYCATDPRYERVPPAPKVPKEKGAKEEKKQGHGAPTLLLAPTLADALKAATGGKAAVVSLSLKDRGCVFTGGKRPDACYWFDTVDGNFVTSTYYRDAVHPWVKDYNANRPADAMFGKPWKRLRLDLDYEKHSGPDDVAGEDTGYGQGRTFPHPMDGGLTAPGKKYYNAVYTSPLGNELLLGLVKRAIDAEKLGTHDQPDLLCISFSSNDPIGHNWGPDSQEVLDVTLRADLIVKELLEHLDARVGKGKYMLCLSADHGICPLPEVVAKQGKTGRRLQSVEMYDMVTEFLEKRFPKPDAGRPIEKFGNDSVYLNREWIKLQGVDQAKVESDLAGWLKTQPIVQTAYTRTELLKSVAENDTMGQMVRRSFHPERSGDVMIVLKPYHYVYLRLNGTTHGSPHPYDTHVPLLVYGPGLTPGVREDRVTPQASVAILARALGIKPPAMAEAAVPSKLFREP